MELIVWPDLVGPWLALVVKMTLDVYAHVLSGQDEDAVAKVEAFEPAGLIT